MNELIQQSFAWYNLPFTVLLILVVLYWLLAILGTIDLDLFEFDFDADMDADLDVDLDADGFDGAGGSGSGFFRGLAQFFDLGTIPLTLLASLGVLFGWMISVTINYYLLPGIGLFLGVCVMFGSMFSGLILTKLILMPFRPMLKKLMVDGVKHEPLVGKVCTVRTGEVTDQYGQGELIHKNREKILQIRISPDAEPLRKGDSALLISFHESTLVYQVRAVSDDTIEIQKGHES